MIKLKLNMEFAFRHIAVAVAALGLSAWFAFDGFVTYPAENEAALRKDPSLEPANLPHPERKINEQFIFSGVTGFGAIVILLLLLAEAGKSLSLENGKLKGSLTGGTEIPLEDIASVDESLWEKKNIAFLVPKYSKRIKLDAWHFKGAKEIYLEVKQALEAKKTA